MLKKYIVCFVIEWENTVLGQANRQTITPGLHTEFSLRNLKFHDLRRSSGAVVIKHKRPFLYSRWAAAWMEIGAEG